MANRSLTQPNLLEKRSINGRRILYFNNKEAYLAGIYPNIQTLDGVNGDRSSIAAGNVDFGPSMDLLARHKNNFFRHWVIFYPNFVNTGNPPFSNINPSDCSEKNPALSFTSGGEPWRKRYSPFLYTPSGKWDLSQYNDEYFLKLRKMVETAYNHRIVVQLTLFDRTGISAEDCSRWTYSPWNAKNNINQVIQASGSGVNSFYNRDLEGVIRVRGPQRPRRDPHPPSLETITLGELQDSYVSQVVSSTLEYPNVIYEIMNEPIHNPPGPSREMDSIARVKWADPIVAAIYGLTQGKRFIFYNDHTFFNQNEHARGQDIIQWKNPANGLKNYSHLDGVIFHGNVQTFDPDKLEASIRQDLIVQVSTDAYPKGQEDKTYNMNTAKNAFLKHMMFQAEAVKESTADAIGSAMPTPLR